MAGEPRPIATGAFYVAHLTGPKPSAQRRSPSNLRGRWRAGLAQTSAQMVHGYGHVEVEVRVHTQDHRNLPVGFSAPIVVTFAQLLSMLWSLRPEEQERTDDTVRGHATGELL